MDNEKYLKLKQILKDLGSVIVAYSGGTDSTLVLKVAHDVLGDRVVAMTAVSASLAESERLEAQEVARLIGSAHILVETEETANPDYLANTPNRCFFCKNETYEKLITYAQGHGFQAVVDGTNTDDARDIRPGRKAARDHHIRSPLLESGLAKAEIRQLSKELGLPNWDKPAAACLSSRIPYGTTITIKSLSQVEQAEALLRSLGLRQLRVRHHDTIARIEVEPVDFPVLIEHRQQVVTSLKALGYAYVSLDLAGFRSGSLNEAMKK